MATKLLWKMHNNGDEALTMHCLAPTLTLTLTLTLTHSLTLSRYHTLTQSLNLSLSPSLSLSNTLSISRPSNTEGKGGEEENHILHVQHEPQTPNPNLRMLTYTR